MERSREKACCLNVGVILFAGGGCVWAFLPSEAVLHISLNYLCHTSALLSVWKSWSFYSTNGASEVNFMFFILFEPLCTLDLIRNCLLVTKISGMLHLLKNCVMSFG